MHALLEAGSKDSIAGSLAGAANWEDWQKKGESPRLNVPTNPGELANEYDLTVSRPDIHAVAFLAFDRWLAAACARRGLSCALIHQGVVDETINRVQRGRLRIGFHLDYFALWHVPGDPYARLAFAVQDAGGVSVNSPARSRWLTDKAAAHAELGRAGIPVPPAIVVRPEMDAADLAAEALTRLKRLPGRGAFVKPAKGFGGRGVVAVRQPDADTLIAALRTARQHDPNDTYLIQREVCPRRLLCDDGIERPAYWRVLHCLGQLMPFWWCQDEMRHGRTAYRRVTLGEWRRLRLQPVIACAARLAHLSGLQWFSTELAVDEAADGGRFQVRCPDGRSRPLVAIDYINDQCDVDVQSRWPGAPPDAVVRFVAELFAEEALRLKRATTKIVHFRLRVA